MLELTKDNFEAEVLQAEGLVVVDFWGDSCEPCKALFPDVEALADAYKEQLKFAKLNTTKARRLAISQRVLGLPNISIYKDGAKLDEVTGKEVNKQMIEDMIKKHLG
ncbi:MAG: thiol reductase thioredoxin [Clostridiales bacterium]|nr:MAG: thiol reductase thioredoxin [Clostridiales bacterium]